ncbi:membrane protein [Streptomyces hiroshimensis]|uniref:Membrane protein n=1 Tax=Streptomyces hiroshimensis TaxID=66424 RepID=A0ABQ2YV54_9ACTN|nr:membrane protein [Streptomyces hiroshimensis]
MGFVFRSRSTSKDEQAAAAKVTADQPQQPRDPQAPKGRPTPKRSEANSQRRAMAHTPANRKDAAKRARETRRADLAKQREALANGDERYLPVRDKGPVRRFARDFVDSRYSVAEFFLPLAVVILILSMINRGAFQTYVLLAWMIVIALIVINSAVTAISLKRALKQRFPDENTRGAVAYAIMRTLQMRRLRLPKPKVKRGEKP